MMMKRRKGTIQRQRINPNLLNPKFKIDERSFEDLLAYIVAYLEKINFFTTENVIDGNWKELVEQDPVIYIIGIIKQPIENLHIEDEEKLSVTMIYDLLEWYAKIEKWYHTLLYFKEGFLADKISNVLLDVLHEKKEILQDVLEKINKEKNTNDNIVNLLKKYASTTNNKDEFDLSEINHTFRKMVLYIQNFTSEYLKRAIFSENNHMPNNAMYITFSLLFKKVQDQINQIGQRHLDFYYKDVLQQVPSKGIATQTVVYFQLHTKSKEILIPEKTALTAGKLFDSKKDILFETTKPLLASPIEISTLQTLYFNKSPFIKIGTNFPTISNIIKNNLICNKISAKNIANKSLFGADEDSIIDSGISSKITTDVGFMIGSQVLFLEEGQREIRITFTLEKESSKNTFWKLLDEIVLNKKLPLDVIFNTVFEDAFVISYTTSVNWETINSYSVKFNREANTFSLHFIVENTAPPISVLASDKKYDWPMIKVVLDEYAPVYVYSFLKDLKLEKATIDVNVTDIKNLSVYNNIGKMPLTKVFNLFGSAAKIGDYLLVGKSELFKKELSNVNINIEWEVVPLDYGGFETYYKGYSEKFTNTSFRVDVTGLSNGYWLPTEEDKKENISLFDTISVVTEEGYNSEIISKNKTIKLSNLDKYQLPKNYTLQDPVPYNIHTNSGFLKLTLIAPNNAFGKEVYQQNYINTATYNAKNNESLPLPNKAFIPKVKRLTLDYIASDAIYFNNNFNDITDEITGNYIHLTPFGREKTVDNSKVSKNTIISNFDGEGYLYLKLDKIEEESTVSLFFDLNNNTSQYSKASNNIIFEYLKIDVWGTLPKKNIISDGTDQLSKSGIIEILIPNNVLSVGNQEFSLRFVAKKEAYKYPIINGIHPNAVIASCTSNDENVIGKKVAAESIIKVVNKITAIKKVVQPTASFGGKIPTTPELFYTEVSERLRHKDRALTVWDYEHLILQYFHEIIAVKCTNLNQFFKPQAGKITLIVLSNKWKHYKHHYFNGNELDAIHQFIKKKSNSFIKIKVINPTVEWLLVTCIVEFEAKDQGGYYLNALNTELCEYLCPITHEDSTAVQGIGTTIVPRMLKSYLENLSYIESIKKLEIEHIIKKGLDDFSVKIYEENEEINPTKPWSILVPKNKHNIYSSAILEDETIAEIESQNLQIGVDYIVAGDYEDEKEIIASINQTEEVIAENTVILKKSKSDTVLTFKINNH
ncbi:hypothetical protein [Tenacibaculum salmonis]|uniref:hypothetical protein n=1 Tax=Tenacibaculum sp. P3-BQ1 TaxID=3232310 RepID=UPI0034DFF2DB